MDCCYVDSILMFFLFYFTLPIDSIKISRSLSLLVFIFNCVCVHWFTISKGFEICVNFLEKAEVSAKDYISFIFLVIFLYDFYFKLKLMPLETFLVAKTGTIEAKVIAKARVHVLNDHCSKQQVASMKICVKQFREQLGHDKIWVTTKRIKDMAHVLRHDLFVKSGSPLGKRLSEVKIKEIPQSFLSKGIDDDEFINFAANIETIRLVIAKIGLKKFVKMLVEAGIDLLL